LHRWQYFLPQSTRAQTYLAAGCLRLDLGDTQHERTLVIKDRRPCVSVRSRFCDHACAKLCITCAVSGVQGCLLLAATLRSVNGPGASMAPGQAAAARAGNLAPGEHIAEARAGSGTPDARHQATEAAWALSTVTWARGGRGAPRHARTLFSHVKGVGALGRAINNGPQGHQQRLHAEWFRQGIPFDAILRTT